MQLSALRDKWAALMKQLKVKKASGEKLELTQYKKLDSEAELRKDLPGYQAFRA
ncbi:hypothetical protein JCM10449v2_006028 [Rhodotorula kratochvilovae]